MRKFVFCLCCLTPLIVNAETNLDMRIQMLDAQIAELTHQRDEKYTKLSKCEQTTSGFKIAGLTTLVATGIGIYGNIQLAKKSKGGNSFGGGSRPVDTRPQEEKDADSCGVLCEVGAAPAGCNC